MAADADATKQHEQGQALHGLAVSVIPPLEACILMTGISVALYWHLKEIS